MNYIEIATSKYPISEREIRSLFPNTSFPSPFKAPEGYALVFTTPAPTHNPLTESVREVAPVAVNGAYSQKWEIIPLPEEVASANQAREAERIRDEIMVNVQKYLDEFARTKTYDGILSACTYATSTFPKFAVEGQYCVQMRDTCWGVVAQIESDVLAGVRPIPSGFEDVKAELPALAWPE